MNKIEKSKEKLFHLYIEEKMTQDEIAEIYGVSRKTIGKWLSHLIEFDGRQHFEPIEYWGGEEGFKTRQFYDSLKNSFAEENGFKLLRFNYLQSEEVIEKEFKKSVKI